MTKKDSKSKKEGKSTQKSSSPKSSTRRKSRSCDDEDDDDDDDDGTVSVDYTQNKTQKRKNGKVTTVAIKSSSTGDLLPPPKAFPIIPKIASGSNTVTINLDHLQQYSNFNNLQMAMGMGISPALMNPMMGMGMVMPQNMLMNVQQPVMNPMTQMMMGNIAKPIAQSTVKVDAEEYQQFQTFQAAQQFRAFFK